MMIVGDLNEDPGKLEAVRDLIEDEGRVDLGEKASWWGSPAAEKTCKQREGVEETRIDAVLVNKETLPWIRNFRVIHDPAILTHKVLQVQLATGKHGEDSQCARTLQSLKKLWDQKMTEETEGKEEKEANDHKKERRKGMHDTMDEDMDKISPRLREHLENDDIDKYWGLLSRAVEKSVLKHLEEDEETRKAMQGRGVVKFIGIKKNSDKAKSRMEIARKMRTQNVEAAETVRTSCA